MYSSELVTCGFFLQPTTYVKSRTVWNHRWHHRNSHIENCVVECLKLVFPDSKFQQIKLDCAFVSSCQLSHRIHQIPKRGNGGPPTCDIVCEHLHFSRQNRMKLEIRNTPTLLHCSYYKPAAILFLGFTCAYLTRCNMPSSRPPWMHEKVSKTDSTMPRS